MGKLIGMNRIRPSALGRKRAICLERAICAVEMMERRVLMSTTITVTSTLDDGGGSVHGSGSSLTADELRNALDYTNTASSGIGPVTIDLTGLSGTVSLEGPLDLSTSAFPIEINGPGANILSINGDENGNVFVVDSESAPITASISGLTLTGGSVSGSGGGIENHGVLTLSNCTITGDSAFEGFGLPFPTGNGGGIYNAGTLNVSGCTISHNTTDNSGAGIFNSANGTLTITNTTIGGSDAMTEGNVSGLNGGGIFNAAERPGPPHETPHRQHGRLRGQPFLGREPGKIQRHKHLHGFGINPLCQIRQKGALDPLLSCWRRCQRRQ